MPRGVKAGALAAWLEKVAFFGPVGMLAGVKDGDSTFRDFLLLSHSTVSSSETLNKTPSGSSHFLVSLSILARMLPDALLLAALLKIPRVEEEEPA